jgi:hypothetical protein
MTKAAAEARSRALYKQVRASMEYHFGHSLTITDTFGGELLVSHQDVGDLVGFLPQLSTRNEVDYRVGVYYVQGGALQDRRLTLYEDDDNHVSVMLDTVQVVFGHLLPPPPPPREEADHD